ncbi:ATP-binding response regulator [Novosphingobium beihaiensis]|uniref:histidine kinase n=1 Tax=Novosphingobium beihaiensis TaxID=2930389 RepID=A0ABT0BRL4_9SPHN|nr:ATP-binding protein [Novosphingobium beihaiensis]MCJ2187693.1 ATP-binding protein [Novosphingobium beihaiensis]
MVQKANDLQRNGGAKRFWPQNLKIEIAAFVLILLTFAAVAFKERFTGDILTVTRSSSARTPYSYASADENGASSISNRADDPMDWECHLRGKENGAYCGFGYVLDQRGMDFTHFENIVLDFDFDPPNDQEASIIFSLMSPPDSMKSGEVLAENAPNSITVSARPGRNIIQINPKDLKIEPWWLAKHSETKQRQSGLRQVVSVQITITTPPPGGDARINVRSIRFTGDYISDTNWYLLLIGIWGLASGALIIYRLISSRREFEARKQRLAQENQAIAEAREAAEAASAAKSQFLANMSHELRTPLNAIIGYAQLIASDSATERDRTSAVTILESGKHLLEVIGDILDIAKIEAGKLEVAPSCLDLPQFLQSVARIMRLRAEAKGLALELTLAPDLPRHIEADGKRLRQILFNLLGNAVKFTEQGTIGLAADSVGSGAEQRLRLVVTDTGTGIPEGKLEAIFEPFEQVGTSVDRSGGTGLGLSITRRIVDTMGGDIGASSVPGEGSRFTVKVPLIETSPDLEHEPEFDALRGARLLIALPAETARDGLRRMFEAYGAEIEMAADGIETISAASRMLPEAIIMACDMPLVAGPALVARLCENGNATSHPPIFVLAGEISNETRASLTATGATQVMALTTNGTNIVRAVARALVSKPVQPEAEVACYPPPRAQIEKLLDLARAGNLRAISRTVPDIMTLGPQYRIFGDRVASLAGSYQSKALLQMLEASLEEAGACQ